MIEEDDRQAIQRVKAGEIDQYSFIVNKYTKIIYSVIGKKVGDSHDIEDLVQNTFLSFYRNIHRFDEEKKVLPYLYEIAKNEVRMFYRSHKKKVPLNEEIVADSKQDIFSDVEDVETIIKGLSEEQKQALQLVYEGYSYKEIADKLKRPLNTVRTIIRRARLSVLEKHDYKTKS